MDKRSLGSAGLKRTEPRPARESTHRAWVWFLVLWAAAVAVRWIYLASVADAPDMLSPILDSNWNRTQAMRIAGGEWLQAGPFWRPPGYSYFLGPLLFLTRGDLLAARIVQAVVAGAACGWIYLIGRRVFSHAVGLLAGSIAVFYQMFIYFSVELLATTLEVFTATLMLVAVLRAEDRGTRRAWFWAGVLVGLSALVRPNVLVFAVVLFLFVKGLRSWRWNRGPALAFAAGTLAAILPVTGMNALHGGDTVLIAAQGGVNLYIGNSPYADGKTVLLEGEYDPEYARTLGEYHDQVHLMSIVMAEQATGRTMKPSDVDRFWFRRTLRTIADDPGRFARLLLRKTYYFWNSYEASNNRNIERFLKEQSPWLRLPFPGFGIIAPLGLLGMVVSWRRGRREKILVLFVAAQMVSVIAFFVCARYRLSAVSVLIVFAAFAVFWLVRKIREADWARLGAAAAVLAAALWVAHSSYADVRGVPNAGLHYFNQALAFSREGRFDEAAELLHRVAELNPYDPMVRCALGSTLLKAGRYDDAREAYEEAISMKPSLGAIGHSDLGTYLAGEGRIKEAVGEFRAALDVDPEFIHARMNLAGLLSNSGRPEEALGHFGEVLRQAPTEAGRLLPEVAVTLDRLGRRQEAIDTLRQSISKDGTNARAHALLAGYLEEAGDLQGAAKEWESARQWARTDSERLEAEQHLKAIR